MGSLAQAMGEGVGAPAQRPVFLLPPAQPMGDGWKRASAQRPVVLLREADRRAVQHWQHSTHVVEAGGLGAAE